MEFKHTSVLLKETIEELRIRPDGIYVDGTLGGGGHSYEIAKQLGESGRLIGIDQDGEAIRASGERLKEFGRKVVIVKSNFRNTAQLIKSMEIDRVDGILLDLGVSSYQLDNQERGFSYRYDAALDMRMDTDAPLTAGRIVNEYGEMELYRVIRDYGEERFAKNIARHIVQARGSAPIETTGQLNEIVKAAIPAKMRAQGGHPSKRTFQAIRIECNRELEVLQESMDELIGLLNPQGRICIITFHSLEDRIVKNAFRKAENPCTCPPEFPVCVCGRVSQGKVITGKPIIPGEEELEKNPRAASAKLRVFEKS